MRLLTLSLGLALPLHASIIGTSKPTPGLTEARILALPKSEQKPWLDYLHRSEAQKAADKAALAAERQGMAPADIPKIPRQGYSARAMPLNREAAFYTTAEATRIGDIVITFQLPSGGWSKNLAFDKARARGQSYATANLAPTPVPDDDFDKPHDPNWHYMGTLDNDATNTELHFLAALSFNHAGHDGDKYRAAFLRGVEYLLHAQFPNGGWPQGWPLEGGYHDAITFNDDAVTESAELLTLAAEGKVHPPNDPTLTTTNEPSHAEDYTFVPAATRALAKAAATKALDCILATQLKATDGPGTTPELTIWAQQNDPLTLLPVTARNYEPEALASGESASVVDYLMSLPHPSAAVIHAIDAAVAWFQQHKIMGQTYGGGRNTPGGRKLTATPGAGPIWARYYSLTTGKPIFGDRDKSIHDDVAELSLERRNGYGWYGSAPEHTLKTYAAWKPKHP